MSHLTRPEAPSSEVVVKPLEGVSDKRQTHFGTLLLLTLADAALGRLLRLKQGGVVRLVDLVRREVGGVDVGRQTRLEGGADTPQAIELYTEEESVALDFVCAPAAETVLRVTNEAGILVSATRTGEGRGRK